MINKVIFNSYKDAFLLSLLNNIPVEYFIGGYELNGIMYFLPNSILRDKHNLENKKYHYKQVVYNCLEISKYAGLKCYFITFTLNDICINYDKKRIIKHIRDNLKKLSYYKFILNEDYGRSTSRLHYHCLLFTRSNINNLKYNYGFFDIKEININKSIENISSYLAKFEKHAYKNTIKLIYSRFNYKHLFY